MAIFNSYVKLPEAIDSGLASVQRHVEDYSKSCTKKSVAWLNRSDFDWQACENDS